MLFCCLSEQILLVRLCLICGCLCLTGLSRSKLWKPGSLWPPKDDDDWNESNIGYLWMLIPMIAWLGVKISKVLQLFPRTIKRKPLLTSGDFSIAYKLWQLRYFCWILTCRRRRLLHVSVDSTNQEVGMSEKNIWANQWHSCALKSSS